MKSRNIFDKGNHNNEYKIISKSELSRKYFQNNILSLRIQFV